MSLNTVYPIENEYPHDQTSIEWKSEESFTYRHLALLNPGVVQGRVGKESENVEPIQRRCSIDLTGRRQNQ